MNHPSELKLERHLLDPGQSQIGDHVSGCEHCQGRLLAMRQQGEDFRRFVYPATLDEVSRPRWRPMRALWLLAPAAGLATVLLVTRPGPPPDYVGTKGQPLELTVYVARDSGAHALADGESVPASASLRMRVHADSPCKLAVFSLDGSGQSSSLYASPGRVSGAFELPGTVRLDGKVGPERIFAVCEAPKEPLEEAIRRVAGDREEGVRHNATLSDVEFRQTSVLIEKTP
jgi:hypothetical protein